MSKKTKSETIYRVDHLPGDEIDLEQEFDQKQSYREYDENGNLLFEITYTRDGEIADKIEHRYDYNGRLSETLVYGEDDEVLERKEVYRGDKDRVEKEITYYLDGSSDHHEYFYDAGGNLIGMSVKDDEGEPDFSEKYFYEDSRVVKVERYDSEDEVVFHQEDEYNNGVISIRKTWSSEEEEPFTAVIRFNAAGHREEELRYNDRDQLIERNLYEEDENGRLIRIIEENRQRKNTTEFSYDANGNAVHQVETDLHGELNHEVFRVFDPEGNLAKTTVETVIKPSGLKRAYSLIFKTEEAGN
jgi:YD repeat-containing protein